MATNYPGSLDSWSNPTSTTALNATGFEHDVVHSNVNDAIEAIEGELGTDPAGGAATVKARLLSNEALGWHPTFPTAGYWYAQFIPGASLAGAAVTADRQYYRRIVIPETDSLAAIGLYVTIGVGSTNVRVGVYENSAGVPGSLLVDAGTASTASSSTWVDIACTQQLVGNTVYWLSALFSGAPSVVAGTSSGNALDGVGAGITTGGTAMNTRGFYHSQTYGSLPSTAGTGSVGAVVMPNIFVRF